MAIFSDLLVVDFGSGLATSLTTMILADNGADVVLIEPPGGDPFRHEPAWIMWNRGKKSIVLDPASPADAELARQLVRRADILVQNAAAAAAAGWPLEYERLQSDNPRLIQCSITAIGSVGDYADLPAYDALVEAKGGGCLDLSSWMRREVPSFRARPNPSYAAANLAVQGIAAALVVRAETGLGQHIQTSLYQGYECYNFASGLNRQSELGLAIPPMPPRPKGSFEPFLPYLPVQCKDGQWMQITNNTDRLFKTWMHVLDLDEIWADPDLKSAPRIGEEAARWRLVDMIQKGMSKKTFDEWMTIFLKEGLTGDRYLTTEQAMDHPQVRHNGLVVEVDQPGIGVVQEIGLLAEFADSPGQIQGAAPAADEHRASVAALATEVSSAPQAASQPRRDLSAPPLAGLLILDFAAWLAGPFASSLLSDLGARVIKIESPMTNDGQRIASGGRIRTFQGKESLVIDLKQPSARKALTELLARSDGIVHNMRPDAAARLGLDYESVRRINPEVVYLYAASYGSTGPGEGRAAFHPTMGALSGGVLRQMGRGNEPAPADTELTPEQVRATSLSLLRSNETSPDITGALAAGTAVAMALYHRRNTGRGQYLETTMLGSNLYLCSENFIRYPGKPTSPEIDREIRGTGALNRLYRAAEGWLMVCCPLESQWRGLCQAIGLPELADDYRFATRDSRRRYDNQLIAVLSQVFKQKTAAQWEELLRSAKVPAVKAEDRSADDFLLLDPQVRENEFITEVDDPGTGRMLRLSCGIKFSMTPGQALPAREFGADGRNILSWLGIPDAEIDAMIADGVLVVPDLAVASD
jgi:crotonobetainyl-CoA:carnitine CoA-transferase CaiB-like acyl-CoA transferase